MKRPTLPKNDIFWLQVAGDPNLVNEFMARGDERQKKELSKTLSYLKWQRIQERLEYAVR